MGNTTSTSTTSSSNNNNRRVPPYTDRVETLVLATPLDVERAMASTTRPKRVVVHAKLLTNNNNSNRITTATRSRNATAAAAAVANNNNNTTTNTTTAITNNPYKPLRSPLYKILQRVGCTELCVRGTSSSVPRRVYEHELVLLLQSIPHARHGLQKIWFQNLDIQQQHYQQRQQQQQQQLDPAEAAAAATAAAAAVLERPDVDGQAEGDGNTRIDDITGNNNIRDYHQEEEEEEEPAATLSLKHHFRHNLPNLQELHLESCRLDESTTLRDILLAVAVRRRSSSRSGIKYSNTSKQPRLRQLSLNLCDPILNTATQQLLEETVIQLLQVPKKYFSQQYLYRYHPYHRRRRCRKQPSPTTALTHLALSEFPRSLLFWQHVATSSTLTHLSLSLDRLWGATDNINNNSNNNANEEQTSLTMPNQQQQYWDLLQLNTSIEQLELQASRKVYPSDSRPLQPLIDILKENTTLRTLVLHLNDPNSSSLQQQSYQEDDHNDDDTQNIDENSSHSQYGYLNSAIIANDLTYQVLERHNFTLHTVHLMCYNFYGYQVRIPHMLLDFYTKLNRQGRQQLFRLQDDNPKTMLHGEGVSNGGSGSGDCGSSVCTTFSPAAMPWELVSNSTDAKLKSKSCLSNPAPPKTTTTKLLGKPIKSAASPLAVKRHNDIVKAWVETALVANSYDISSTYYWLKSNPNMFSSSSSVAPTNNNDTVASATTRLH